MVADCGATCAKYVLCLFNFAFFVSKDKESGERGCLTGWDLGIVLSPDGARVSHYHIMTKDMLISMDLSYDTKVSISEVCQNIS